MENIIAILSDFVNELLSWQLPEDLFFHNKQHTHNVVAAVLEIGEASQLTDADWTALLAAAWFHDTGYCYIYKGHEAYSVVLAERFFKHYQLNADLQQQVAELIGATQVPQQPFGLLQEIICDADLFHLSRPDYPDYADRLRWEWAVKMDKSYTDKEWQELNIRFLENHTYFTAYAQQHWEPLKLLNLQRLRNS